MYRQTLGKLAHKKIVIAGLLSVALTAVLLASVDGNTATAQSIRTPLNDCTSELRQSQAAQIVGQPITITWLTSIPKSRIRPSYAVVTNQPVNQKGYVLTSPYRKADQNNPLQIGLHQGMVAPGGNQTFTETSPGIRRYFVHCKGSDGIADIKNLTTFVDVHWIEGDTSTVCNIKDIQVSTAKQWVGQEVTLSWKPGPSRTTLQESAQGRSLTIGAYTNNLYMDQKFYAPSAPYQLSAPSNPKDPNSTKQTGLKIGDEPATGSQTFKEVTPGKRRYAVHCKGITGLYSLNPRYVEVEWFNPFY